MVSFHPKQYEYNCKQHIIYGGLLNLQLNIFHFHIENNVWTASSIETFIWIK